MGATARVVTWVTVAIVGAIGAEIALASTGSAPPPRLRPDQVASRMTRAALGAAGAAGTFHYRAVWQTGGSTQTIVGDAAPSAGTQAVEVGGSRFAVVVADQVVYVTGNVEALHDQLGLAPATASADAGRWIALAQADGPYQSMEEGVTTAAALSQVLIAPRRTSTDRRAHGMVLSRVTGRIPPGTPGQVIAGSATLDVAARTTLPAAYTAGGSDGGQPWSSSITFSRWGERMAVTPPADALPYSALQGVAASGPGTPTG